MKTVMRYGGLLGMVFVAALEACGCCCGEDSCCNNKVLAGIMNNTLAPAAWAIRRKVALELNPGTYQPTPLKDPNPLKTYGEVTYLVLHHIVTSGQRFPLQEPCGLRNLLDRKFLGLDLRPTFCTPNTWCDQTGLYDVHGNPNDTILQTFLMGTGSKFPSMFEIFTIVKNFVEDNIKLKENKIVTIMMGSCGGEHAQELDQVLTNSGLAAYVMPPQLNGWLTLKEMYEKGWFVVLWTADAIKNRQDQDLMIDIPWKMSAPKKNCLVKLGFGLETPVCCRDFKPKKTPIYTSNHAGLIVDNNDYVWSGYGANLIFNDPSGFYRNTVMIPDFIDNVFQNGIINGSPESGSEIWYRGMHPNFIGGDHLSWKNNIMKKINQLNGYQD